MTYAAFPNLAKSSYEIDVAGEVIRSPVLDGLLWLTHGMTTRRFAGPDLDVFDLMEQVRRRLAPGGARLFCGEQVHGARVETIAAPRRDSGAERVAARGPIVQLPDTDALVVSDPALPIAVRTADCVPLLLVDVRKKRVAAVHAGWRGSLARISEKAVAAMAEQGSDVAELVAWMGPTISRAAYAVGAELSETFCAAFPEYEGIVEDEHLDLVLLNACQLRAAGVPAAQIHAANYCTVAHRDVCYSYRGEHASNGRMVLCAMILSPDTDHDE